MLSNTSGGRVLLPISLALCGCLAISLFATIVGVGVGFGLRNSQNSTDNNVIPPGFYESNGVAVLIGRFLAGDTKLDVPLPIDAIELQNTVNSKLRVLFRQIQTLPYFIKISNSSGVVLNNVVNNFMNVTVYFVAYFKYECFNENCVSIRETNINYLFKGLTINSGAFYTAVESANTTLGPEIKSLPGTFESVTQEINMIPPTVQLFPMIAEWEAIVIKLTRPLGRLEPALETNQVPQIIHDLNTVTEKIPVVNQTVIFFDAIGTPIITFTPTLTIALKTLHYLGCINCEETLKTAVLIGLNNKRVSQFTVNRFNVREMQQVMDLKLKLLSAQTISLEEEQALLTKKAKFVRTSIPLTIPIKCKTATGNAAADCPTSGTDNTAIRSSIFELFRTMNKIDTLLTPYSIGPIEYIAPTSPAQTTTIKSIIYYNSTIDMAAPRSDYLKKVLGNKDIVALPLMATIVNSNGLWLRTPALGLYVAEAEWNELVPF